MPIRRLAALLLVAAGLSSASTWPNGYSYRRAITITPGTSNTVSGYPYLRYGSCATLMPHVTNASGYDVIFTSDANGSVTLPYERAQWAAAGTCEFYIYIASLPTTTTTIYQFTGNASVSTDQSNAAGVWGNYYAVYHGGAGTSLVLTDSTGNGHTLTNAGALSYTASGMIGGAFATGTSSTGYGYASMGIGSTFSMEAWAITTTNPISTECFLSAGTVNTGTQTDYVGFSGMLSGDHTLNWGNATANNPVTLSGAYLNWHYYLLVQGSSSSTVFVDAANEGTFSYAYSGNGTGAIGNRASFTSQYWGNPGTVDEVRFASVQLSQDYATANYNNVTAPGSFYSDSPDAQAGQNIATEIIIW